MEEVKKFCAERIFQKILPINAEIDDKFNVYISDFMDGLHALIKSLMDDLNLDRATLFSSAITDVSGLTPKDLKVELFSFASTDYYDLKKEREYVINYMMLFMYLMETIDITNVQPNSDGYLPEKTKVDYFLLITKNVSWIYVMNYHRKIEKLLEILIHMYKLTVIFYEECIRPQDLVALYFSYRLPSMYYKKTIHNDFITYYLLIDRFFDAEKLDEKSREKYQSTTNNILKKLVTHIDDSDINDLAGDSFQLIKVTEKMKSDIQNGDIPFDDMTSLGTFLISSIGNKEMNPELKSVMTALASQFVYSVEMRRKMGQPISDQVNEMCKTVKKYFYDPKYVIPKDVLKKMVKTKISTRTKN